MLSKIIDGDYTAVVASAAAAAQYTMPPQALKERSFKISSGDEINLDDMATRLVKAGYSRFDQVDGTSQFSIRGGLLDIFRPVRMTRCVLSFGATRLIR